MSDPLYVWVVVEINGDPIGVFSSEALAREYLEREVLVPKLRYPGGVPTMNVYEGDSGVIRFKIDHPDDE